MKSILYFFAFFFISTTLAQNTEVHLFDIKNTDGKLSLVNHRNVSNNDGYDNQPSFYNDNLLAFVSTRNNNFSNRSQKFMVRVTGLQEWEIAVISISVVLAVGAPIAGFFFWAMYMKQMGFKESCLIYCCCCLGAAAKASSSGGGKKRKKKKKAMATSAADVTMDSNNQA